MMHYQQRQSSTVSPYSRGSSSATTSSFCPVLLSVFAWSVTLLLIVSCLDIADAGLTDHRFGKRSSRGIKFELQCKGNYDPSLFARLNRICDDCYNLFHAAQLYNLCMESCFTSVHFKGCVDVLLMQDELPEIKKSIRRLHGAPVPDYS